MISFVSLFLGLVLGHQTVVVQVTDKVAQVEIRLDGQPAGTIEGPPWQTQIDLGEVLVPHELAAVALDASGAELDRAVQWLNLPRPLAETTILLERDPKTGRSVARVSWESLTGDKPSQVRANFDGRALTIDDPRLIELPPFDSASLHFLRVEMDFTDFLGSSAEITFGGTYTDQVNTELTAFPIVLESRKRKTPPLESLQGTLRARDRPLRIAAIEKGHAEVNIVRDEGAWEDLRFMLSKVSGSGSSFSAFDRRGSGRGEWFRPDRQAWDTWTFQFFWPVARRQDAGKGPYDLFSNSQKMAGSEISLHGWIATFEQPQQQGGPQRLADAVAIAGVAAAGTNHRRAVLLVLGDDPADASDVSPATVRQYLTSLEVPLYVWSLDPELAGTSPWGDAVDVSTPEKMKRAASQIFDDLDRQRILWIEGIHLPQQISIAPSVTEIGSVSAR